MGGRQSTVTTAPGGTGTTPGPVGGEGGGPHGTGRGTGASSSTGTDSLYFAPHGGHHHHPHHHHQTPAGAAGGIGGPSSQRQRAISSGAHHRGGFPPVGNQASNGGASGAAGGGALGSPGSDDSTPEDDPISRAILGSSLPVHLFSFRDIKCPVCSKLVPPDDVECHFVMCLTRPRINYNEDVLLEDKDECAICFEELLQGDTIARLPCLCIYHKRCIDQWFKVKRSCPEHPND